jgi:hypothetical protein
MHTEIKRYLSRHLGAILIAHGLVAPTLTPISQNSNPTDVRTYLPLQYHEFNHYPRFDIPHTLTIEGVNYELDINHAFDNEANLVGVIYQAKNSDGHNQTKRVLIPRTYSTRDAIQDVKDNWHMISEVRRGSNAFRPSDREEMRGGSISINGMKGSGVDLSHLTGEAKQLSDDFELINGRQPPIAYDFTASNYKYDIADRQLAQLPRIPFVLGDNHKIETLLSAIESELKVGDPLDIYVMVAREPLLQMQVGMGTADKVALSAYIWAVSQYALNQLSDGEFAPIAVGPNVSTKWQMNNWRQYFEAVKDLINSEYLYTGSEVIRSPFYSRLTTPPPNFSYNAYADFGDDQVLRRYMQMPQMILNEYENMFGETDQEVGVFVLEAGPDDDNLSEQELEEVYYGLLNLHRDYTNSYSTVHMFLFILGGVVRVESTGGGCLEILDQYVSNKHPKAPFISPSEDGQGLCTDHDLTQRGSALHNALVRFNAEQSKINLTSDKSQHYPRKTKGWRNPKKHKQIRFPAYQSVSRPQHKHHYKV